MTKIEEIEGLLKKWKAALAEREKKGHTKVVIEYRGIVRGLTIALQTLDRPSNKKITSVCSCRDLTHLIKGGS